MIVAGSAFWNFSMMSFQCFSLVQKMTSLTFQERKMLYDLLKGTFWSISHQQQTREKHRRGAESVIRKIYERKPATTVQIVHHSLDCATTLASNFTTHSLCIGPTLERQKRHIKNFLSKTLLQKFVASLLLNTACSCQCASLFT